MSGGSIVRLSAIRFGMLLVPSCLLAAGAVSAQPVGVAAPRPPQLQLRSQISIMEAVLERAVGEGIRGAMGEMPDLFQTPPWITPPRARGFKVDGYGVFFDVEVPALPASLWSISVLNRSNEIAVANELNQMRALLAGLADENRRVELSRAIDRLQQRVSGAALSEPGAPPAQGRNVASISRRVPTPAAAPRSATPPRDPDVIYTDEVRTALVAAMLQQGITIQIAPDQWFTVAASQPRGDRGEPDTMTMYLSIQGKDLAALGARQITAEEAARKIVVKNY